MDWDSAGTDDTDEILRRKGVAPGPACSPTRGGEPQERRASFSGPSCIISDAWLFSCAKDARGACSRASSGRCGGANLSARARAGSEAEGGTEASASDQYDLEWAATQELAAMQQQQAQRDARTKQRQARTQPPGGQARGQADLEPEEGDDSQVQQQVATADGDQAERL